MENFFEEENTVNQVNPALNSASGGFAYTAAAAAMVIVSLVIGIIISAASVETWSRLYIYLMYIGSPIALVTGGALTLKVRKIPFKNVFPVKCGIKYYIIALLIVFGLFFSLSRVNEIVLALFGKEAGEASVQLSEFLLSLKGAEVALALLVIAVMPALFEEFLFRGVILNTVEQDAGSIRTIFIVGFCFSLFHTSLEQTAYQFIAGCLFAFVAIRSRSILPGILMHFINNALVIVLAVSGFYGENGEAAVPVGVNVALMALGALALIGGLVWLILDKTPLVKAKKGGVKVFFIYASVGIVILAVLWLVSLFTG